MIPISDPIFLKGMVYAAGPRRVREILDAEAEFRRRERADAELLALPLDEMMRDHGVAGWKSDVAVTPPVVESNTVTCLLGADALVAGGVAGTSTVPTEVLAPESPPASTSGRATRPAAGNGRRPFWRRKARA